MSHKAIMKVLQKGMPIAGGAGHLSTGVASNIYKILEKANAFYIEDDVENSPAYEEEISASIKAMKEAEVLRLPTPIVYHECSAYFLIKDRNVKSYFRLGTLVVNDPSLPSQGIVAIFLRPQEAARNAWGIVPVRLLEPSLDEVINANCLTKLDFNEAVLNMDSQLKLAFESLFYAAVFRTRELIVLLSTKGIEQEYVYTRRKCNLIERPSAEDGYTIVRISQKPRTAKQSNFFIEGRKKVRLHLRRGHLRRQRYGPELCHERTIFIEPVLVGYEEEGKIQHDYLIQHPIERRK